MSTPTRSEWDEADNVAGARFRYRSATDRQRIVERIAYALAKQRERANHNPSNHQAAKALDDLAEELTLWARMADNNAEEWPEDDHRRSTAIGRGNGYRRSILRAKAHAMSLRVGGIA